MTVFSTSPITPRRATPDPAKHVRFSYGMVLDADDFGQEFAYLAARDQWIARDLVGYGTVSGLKVAYEKNGDAPRLVVTAGVAVTPRGEIVHVGRAQCAVLNDWLKTEEATAKAEAAKTGLTTSRIDLYVTLCYRECETDNLPIPGEPCRDESEMMAPTRVVDDFKLELRLTAPEQPDERAIRDFVQWLSAIPIVDGPSSVTLDEFLDAITYAAVLVGSPPSSGPDFMYGSPPALVKIGRADSCQYLRAAYRLWVVELRGKWNASWWDGQAGCRGDATSIAQTPESCVLLSRVSIPLVKSGLTSPQAWKVATSPDPVVDDEQRPFLVPVRMLQEWLWCGRSCGGSAGAAAPTDGEVVAAGFLTVTSPPQPPSGKYEMQAVRPSPLPAAPPPWSAGDFLVKFKGYQRPTLPGQNFVYVVSVTPVVGPTLNPRLEVAAFDDDGIRLRLKNSTTPISPTNLEFMIEVKKYAK